MYKIIGADGNQYGPVSADQVRNWITEGRANAQSLVQPEGATEWKRLGELPEFADLLARPAVPPLAPTTPPSDRSAAQQVNGPAVGLMVVAILGFLLSVTGLIMNLAGVGLNLPGMDQNTQAFTRIFAGTLGAISTVVSLILSGLVLWGALKMKALQNYGLAMTASILALVPCLSPCCLLGLPIGIWAMVVLLKPEVKSAFR